MSDPEALLLATLLLLGLGYVKSSTYAYTEVIVPRQLRTKDRLQTQTALSYILRVEGAYRIIHLRHINFVVPNLPVYSYNMKGDRIADYPHIQDDCFYSGFVEDATDSRVVLSTCSGLWGHVQVEDLKYEIEPIESSNTFQHFIYRKTQGDYQPCGGVLGDEGNQTRDFSGTEEIHADNADSSDREIIDLESHAPVRYLEFYSVVDSSKVLAQRQNETQLIRNMLLVMADVHSIYLEIGLHVYLVGLELWTMRDYIVISETLSEILKEFQSYTSFQLLRHPNFDHANLITTRGQRLGLSSGEHYCQFNFASVSVIRSVGSLTSDADQIAHELGHSLGFYHDNPGRACDCSCFWKPGFCIMHSNYRSGGCRRLSNCSRATYADLVKRPGKECLLNKPKKPLKAKVCGNGVVDHGEECDCGYDEDCKSSGCCEVNCKLKPEADCVSGTCCEKCKNLPVGTMCRAAATECDLAEYCSGTMGDCPADFYMQDGTPCSGSSSTCYAGQCSDIKQQCMNLFGNDAKRAPLSCFEEVNMRGDRSGNCGQEGTKFKKCHKEDVLCGRLQCTHVYKIPRLPTGQAILQTPVDKILCWGTEFHLNLGANDLGAVRDGTSCGSGKICFNRSCISLEILRYDCDLRRCHHRGVCNNQKNCHCTYGWAPPYCKGKGYGGSIDSGPPPVYQNNLIVVIAVVTLGAVILAAFLALSIYKREELKAWLAPSDEKQEPSEPELTSDPEDTPDPVPEPLPETQPVKRTPSKRTSHAKQKPDPEPILQPPYPRQPEARPQPEYPPQPETRPQPQNPPQPQPTPAPAPRPQPQNPPQPAPRPQPQNPPEPKPQTQYTQTEPRPQPQYPRQPEARPQTQYPQQQPKPQPQQPPQPQHPRQASRTQTQYPKQPQYPRQESRTQSQHRTQPEPRSQSQNPREPRPQSRYVLRPEPRPQSQIPPQRESRLPPQRESRLRPEQSKMRKPTQKSSKGSN